MDIRERVGVGRIGRLRLTYIYYHLVGSCYKAQKAQLGAPEAGAGWGGGTEVLPGGGGPQQIPQVRGCSRVTPGAANRRLVELDAWGVSSRPEPPPDFSEPPFPLLQGESTIPI